GERRGISPRRRPAPRHGAHRGDPVGRRGQFTAASRAIGHRRSAVAAQPGSWVLSSAPAVGQGLQDHLAVSYFYKSRVPTLNDELVPLIGKLRAALRYALTRSGPLAMSVNQAGAFVRSRPELSRPNLHL